MMRPIQPAWANEEERRLALEWEKSDSDQTITDYIWEHASEKLKNEYKRQKKMLGNKKRGTIYLPEGNVIFS